MKYNRREIMLIAWSKYRRTAHMGVSFGQCLRLAWYDAKASHNSGKTFEVWCETSDGMSIIARTNDESEAYRRLEYARRAWCTTSAYVKAA